MGDVANVITGGGPLYTAAKGTAPPSLSAKPTAADWLAAGWTAAGYTDDGVQFDYAPTFTEIFVDEEAAPIDEQLSREKLAVKVKLAESTIENLNKAIAASTLTNPGEGIKTLKVGSMASKNVPELAIGFQGPSKGGSDARVIVIYRAKNTGGVTFAFKREGKIIYDVTWAALADSSKAEGERLFMQVDFGVGS